jgi:HEAT repeat protein
MITAVTLLNLQTCARNDLPVPLPLRDLNADELAPLYMALGAEDFLTARQAQRQLLAGPRQTVPFLGKTLAPVKAVAPEKIDRLIAGLDANDFATRQKASAELEKLGEQTHAALRRQLAANPTLEVRRRIERILEATADEEATPDLRRALRAIEILAHIATPQAHEVLGTLAGGAPGSYVTQAAQEALERLKDASKNR